VCRQETQKDLRSKIWKSESSKSKTTFVVVELLSSYGRESGRLV
jgi:hypothetical protein